MRERCLSTSAKQNAQATSLEKKHGNPYCKNLILSLKLHKDFCSGGLGLGLNAGRRCEAWILGLQSDIEFLDANCGISIKLANKIGRRPAGLEFRFRLKI